MNNSYIPNNEHFLKRARNIRNELLNRTDRYILSDYPITQEQQIEIKEYRQKLRDFINENKSKYLDEGKWDIPFPIIPNWLNIQIPKY
jgi:hypothetical protein